MTFSFYLRDPHIEDKNKLLAKQEKERGLPVKKRSNETSLQLVVSSNGKVYRKNIGISVRPSDFKKQRTKDEAANSRLRIIENHLNQSLTPYSTEDEIKKALDDAVRLSRGEKIKEGGISQKKKEGVPSFMEYFQEWANRDTPQLRQRRNTLKIITTLMGTSADWNDVDSAYYFRLVAKLKEKKYSVNYIGSIIAKLKTVMSEGYKMKYHHNEDYHQFHRSTERPDTVYLTQQELDALWNLTPANDLEAGTRDLFLLGCYTAMRFSDYSRLSLDNIRDGYVYMTQQKTAGSVIIPASRKVIAILKRNGGHAPKIDQIVFNRKIKEVCFAAGIDSPVEVTKSKGDRHITEMRPKFTQVSSHTARRTGATLLFQTGISLQSLMLITGHKSPQALISYLRLGKEENAQQLKKNPFFK